MLQTIFKNCWRSLLDFNNRKGITKCKNYVWFKIAIITSALEIYSCELPTTSNQVHGTQKISPSDQLGGICNNGSRTTDS